MQLGPPWYVSRGRRLAVLWVTIALEILAIASVLSAVAQPRATLSYVFAGFWAIAPPIWFLIEADYFFDNWSSQEERERFKYEQSLSAKCWAGVGAVLVLVFARALASA